MDEDVGGESIRLRYTHPFFPFLLIPWAHTGVNKYEIACKLYAFYVTLNFSSFDGHGFEALEVFSMYFMTILLGFVCTYLWAGG